MIPTCQDCVFWGTGSTADSCQFYRDIHRMLPANDCHEYISDMPNNDLIQAYNLKWPLGASDYWGPFTHTQPHPDHAACHRADLEVIMRCCPNVFWDFVDDRIEGAK